MEAGVWLAMLTLFLAGGLTPGPAVMLVTTSSMRYGFWPAMAPATGVCASNLLWVTLAASGASLLAQQFPTGFLVIKLAGLGYIFWLAWRMAFSDPANLIRSEPPRSSQLFARGVLLQLSNPNALVFFGGMLPAYIDPGRQLLAQVLVIMATVTVTELVGLATYAAGANVLARLFASRRFAATFYRTAALVMAASALFGVAATWSSAGKA